MHYSKILLLSLFGLAGCSYVPEKVELSYETIIESRDLPAPLTAAHGVAVTVSVVDNRHETTVSRKKGDYGIERASIKLGGDLSTGMSKAMNAALSQLGFTIAEGETEVEVEVQKFYNDFKGGVVIGRGVAELVLGVNVKKKDGHIIYSKTVLGIGENEAVWLHSGKNAKVALEAAFQDAMRKLMNDRGFLQAVLKQSADAKFTF